MHRRQKEYRLPTMKIIKRFYLFFNGIWRWAKQVFWTALVRVTCQRCGQGLVVNSSSWLGGNVILGNNTNFNGMHISPGGTVRIGDNFHSGTECLIIVQYHNYDSGESIPYDDPYINKDVTIEENVWIGHRVIILGGVRIGEGAVIQAGSVVVRDIPKYAVAGGNPAQVFKYRDIDHYECLKNLQKFH